MKVMHKYTVIAESDTPLIVGGEYYFLPSEVRIDLLTKNSRIFHCPDKGYADFYTFNLFNDRLEDIAWVYQHPYPDMSQLKGRYGFKELSVTNETAHE